MRLAGNWPTKTVSLLILELIYKFTVNELPPGFAVLSPKRTRTTFRSTDSEQALRLSSLTRVVEGVPNKSVF